MHNFRFAQVMGMVALSVMAIYGAGCSSTSSSNVSSPGSGGITSSSPSLLQKITGNNHSILIGAVLPLSGTNASAGVSMKRGLDLAMAEVNAAGGVNSQPLALEVADSHGNLNDGSAALATLSDHHDTMLLVGDASVAVANAEKLAHFPQLIGFMCDYVTAVKLTPANGVRIYLNGDQEARAIDSYIVASAVNRVAILHQNELIGESHNRYLLFVLKGDDDMYVHDEAYSSEDHDFDLLANAMQRVDNGALVLAGAGPEYSKILAAFDKVGWKGLVFGYASQCGLAPMSDAPGLAAQALYPVPEFAANPRSTEAGRTFADRFHAVYGVDPDLPAAYAYDNIRAFAAAANQAASSDPIKIRLSFLGQHTYVGAVGRYEIKDDGDTEMPLEMVYANGQAAPPPSKSSTSHDLINVRPSEVPPLPGLVQP